MTAKFALGEDGMRMFSSGKKCQLELELRPLRLKKLSKKGRYIDHSRGNLTSLKYHL